MRINLMLGGNEVYSCKSNDRMDLYSIGYAFVLGKFYEGKSLSDYLWCLLKKRSDRDPDELFKEVISSLNGAWSLVLLKNEDVALIATDRNRTYPLFYAQNPGGYLISNHTNRILEHLGNYNIHEPAAVEFLLSGYVSGDETFYEGIEKVEPGQIVELVCKGNKCKKLKNNYFEYFPEYITGESKDLLKDELASIVEDVFHRYSAALNGKDVVVPVSGGYDSRIISYMLREHSHENMYAYTYGEKDNPQNRIAEQLCQKLKIPWHFVEYNSSVWEASIQSDEMAQYWDFACRGTSSPHIQDFPALGSFLEGHHLSDPVFLPGHVGDAWASEFVLESFQKGAPHPPNEYHSPLRSITGSDVVNSIINRHHNLWPVPKNLWKTNVFSSFADKLLKDTEAFSSPRSDEMWRFVEWVLRNRTSLWIANSCRSFEMLGAKFMLPLADYELIDFFRKLPLKHLLYRNLYQECLSDKIFLLNDSSVKNVPMHSGVAKSLDWKRLLVDCSVKTNLYKKIEAVRKPFRKQRGLASYTWFARGKGSHQLTVREALKPYDVEEALPDSLMKIIAPLLNRPAYTVQCNGLLSAVLLAKVYKRQMT